MNPFDTNVQKVMDFLKQNNYSPSVMSLHRICYKEIRKYLVENRLTYSSLIARSWIQSHSDEWTYHIKTGYRHCFDQLDDFYASGIVLPNHTGPQVPVYAMLKGELKNELDEYLANLVTLSTLSQRRIACARFMLYLQEQGLRNISDLTYEIVLSFHDDDYHRSPASKDVYEIIIRDFLRYYAAKGKCSIGMSLILNKFLIHKTITETACVTDDAIYCHENHAILQWRDIEEYVDAFYRQRYGSSVRKYTKHLLTLLFIYFDMNRLPFMEKNAWEWFRKVKPLLRTNWQQGRRCLCQFLHYRKYGDIITAVTGNPDAMKGIDRISEWMQRHLNHFLSLLQREGRSQSTITMYRSSIVRFCQYLDKFGITDFKEVTPDILQAFNLHDKHSTTDGKSAYNSRIRNFLIHLDEEHIIDNHFLYKALPALSAPKTRIIKVLDESQIKAVWSTNEDALSPKAFRDYAIVSVGLGLGLRASDIIMMKFTDIDWRSRSITLTQQKTGRLISLPLPVNVGNTIFRYFRDARPKSDCPHVFIRHEAPYGKISAGVCRGALRRILGEKQGCAGGFHVLRRTFATSLLRAGTRISIISESLGHSSDDTVHKYLSLDEERMRKCSLSLEEAGIRCGGGCCHA